MPARCINPDPLTGGAAGINSTTPVEDMDVKKTRNRNDVTDSAPTAVVEGPPPELSPVVEDPAPTGGTTDRDEPGAAVVPVTPTPDDPGPARAATVEPAETTEPPAVPDRPEDLGDGMAYSMMRSLAPDVFEHEWRRRIALENEANRRINVAAVKPFREAADAARGELRRAQLRDPGAALRQQEQAAEAAEERARRREDEARQIIGDDNADDLRDKLEQLEALMKTIRATLAGWAAASMDAARERTQAREHKETAARLRAELDIHARRVDQLAEAVQAADRAVRDAEGKERAARDEHARQYAILRVWSDEAERRNRELRDAEREVADLRGEHGLPPADAIARAMVARAQHQSAQQAPAPTTSSRAEVARAVGQALTRPSVPAPTTPTRPAAPSKPAKTTAQAVKTKPGRFRYTTLAQALGIAKKQK